MRVGNPDIDIELETEPSTMPARFDRRLISQALTNIIKNATEAIAAVPPDELGRGRIRVSAAREGGDIVIDVIDNGIGLPKENRNRLLEPYVTTREKGTGLGLAIVGPHSRRARRTDRAARRAGGRFRRRAAHGCDCASPPKASATPAPSLREAEILEAASEIVMASDILIVDDEADIRELVAGILQDEGYEHAHRARQRHARSARSRRAGRTSCSSTSGCRAAKLDGLQLLDT